MEIKKVTDAWVRLMSEIIATKPVSGNEGGAAEIILRELKSLESCGVDSFMDPCGNVVGVLRRNTPEKTAPNVLLNGHMDVVPAGNLEQWGDLDPFKAEVRDGVFYGRGTSDMLGGLISQLLIFKEIAKEVGAGAVIPADLYFSAVVQEEPAESFGAIYLMEETFPKHKINPEFCILGEPTGGKLAVGQRGKVELVVEVFGKVAHSAVPYKGINAVEKAVPVIQAINRCFDEEPVTHITGKSSMVITDVEVSPGRMFSCVPDHCEITIDRRYVQPQSIESCVKQIQDFIDDLSAKDPDFKACVHPRMNKRTSFTGYEATLPKQHPFWYTGSENEYVKEAQKALGAIGLDNETICWPFGTDGSVICGKHGVPTVGYYTAVATMAHQAREHEELARVAWGMEGYYAILKAIL